MHGREERAPGLTSPEGWRSCEEYLFAVDLYNNSYWWECHEALEGLWIAAGRTSIQAHFFQAIIQAAAANLKWHLDNDSAARFLTQESSKKLERVLASLPEEARGRYMGLDVAAFESELQAFHAGPRPGSPRRAHPPLISLGI